MNTAFDYHEPDNDANCRIPGCRCGNTPRHEPLLQRALGEAADKSAERVVRKT